VTCRKDDVMTDATNENSKVILALAWLAVGLPLLWGVAQTIGKAAKLFH
jgi:hypothetical protein